MKARCKSEHGENDATETNAIYEMKSVERRKSERIEKSSNLLSPNKKSSSSKKKNDEEPLTQMEAMDEISVQKGAVQEFSNSPEVKIKKSVGNKKKVFGGWEEDIIDPKLSQKLKELDFSGQNLDLAVGDEAGSQKKKQENVVKKVVYEKVKGKKSENQKSKWETGNFGNSSKKNRKKKGSKKKTKKVKFTRRKLFILIIF